MISRPDRGEWYAIDRKAHTYQAYPIHTKSNRPSVRADLKKTGQTRQIGRWTTGRYDVAIHMGAGPPVTATLWVSHDVGIDMTAYHRPIEGMAVQPGSEWMRRPLRRSTATPCGRRFRWARSRRGRSWCRLPRSLRRPECLRPAGGVSRNQVTFHFTVPPRRPRMLRKPFAPGTERRVSDALDVHPPARARPGDQHEQARRQRALQTQEATICTRCTRCEDSIGCTSATGSWTDHPSISVRYWTRSTTIQAGSSSSSQKTSPSKTIRACSGARWGRQPATRQRPC